MFSWLLIALIIAIIFGVIKVEQIVSFARGLKDKIIELYNTTKTNFEQKSNNSDKK